MYRKRYPKKTTPPGKWQTEREIEDNQRPAQKMGQKKTARSRASGESIKVASRQRRWMKKMRIKKMRQSFKQGPM